MKKFFVFALGFALIAGVSTASFAQTAGPKNGKGQAAPGAPGGPGGQGRMMGGRRMQEEIFAKLQLTDKQKAAIKAINDKYRAEFEKMRPKPTAGTKPPTGAGAGQRNGQRPQMSEADRQKFMKLIQKRNEEIKAVLTAKQRAEYEKLLKEAMDKMRAGGRRPGGTPPPGAKAGGGKSGG